MSVVIKKTNLFFLHNPQIIFSIALIVLVYFLSFLSAFAQPIGGSGYGMLRGKVSSSSASEIIKENVIILDTLTGEKTEQVVRRRVNSPLIGVKVQIKGTSIGAITDGEGRYFIKNIPRGLYDLSYSLDGYKTDVFKNVWIKSDTISEIDILLDEAISSSREIVVTANRFEQRLQDVSLSTSILDPEFITNRNSISIDEALRFVSGVNFTGSDMNIRGSSGVSFGVGSRVQVLIDNVPLLAGDDGSAKWDAFPTDFVERVEVVKGASSALYGASAIGGTVNIVTKNNYETQTNILGYSGIYDAPKFEEWKWTNSTQFFNGIELSHKQQIGRLGIYGSISRRNDDGFRENTDFARLRIFTKLGYRLSDESNLTTLLSFSEERKGNAIYWRDINNILRDGSESPSRIYSDKLFIAPIYTKKISQRNDFVLRGRYYRTNFIDSQNQGSLAQSGGLEFQVISLLGKNFNWTWGSDIQLSSISSSLTGEHFSLGGALYAQAEFPIVSAVTLNFGVRADGFKLNSDSLTGSIKSGEVKASINPKVGAVYHINDFSSVRLNFGTSFRNPSITERFTTTASPPIVPNPNLKPERATSSEIGYLFSYSKPKTVFSGLYLTDITIDASLYLNTYTDLIEASLAPGGITFNNVSNARITGGEISNTFNFNRRALLFTLGYTYLDAKDLTRNTPLYYRNPQLFYLTTEVNIGSFSFEWNYRFIERFSAVNPDARTIFNFSNISNVDETVNANIHDLRLGVQIPIGVINLYVRNLFNHTYIEQPATPAQIRHFFVQFRTQI